MDEHKTGDVTQLLRRYADGDRQAMNELVPMVYEDLKRMARAQLRRSSVGGDMKTTALVHEAYEKLTLGIDQAYRDRQHYMAICARAMRQIVVDEYRSRIAQKRGGGAHREELETGHLIDATDPAAMLALDDALNRLEEKSPELVRILELSTFAGMDSHAIADLTGQSVRTVQRNLKKAKAWVGDGLQGLD